MESGKPAVESEYVQYIGMKEGYALYRVLSGSYSFVADAR